MQVHVFFFQENTFALQIKHAKLLRSALAALRSLFAALHKGFVLLRKAYAVAVCMLAASV